MTQTQQIQCEDGRTLQKPEKIDFIITIGRQRKNGYITDEKMVITTPAGYLVNEELPEPLSRYTQNPSLKNKQGDIRRWETPAGQHIKGERLKEILEKEEKVEINVYEENLGRRNQTELRIEIETSEITP